MTALIMMKIPGDTAAFQASLSSRAEDYLRIAEQSRALGAIHHQFGIGDGYIVVVDEWESVEGFEQFMADPELQAFIGEVGGAGQPEITVAKPIASPEKF